VSSIPSANFACLLVVVACLLSGVQPATPLAAQEQAKPVTRAKRPVFREKDWKGIFFEDLFRDGLRGQRSQVVPPEAGSQPADTALAGGAAADSWSGLIDRDALENEIKRNQQELSTAVTTPLRFSTAHLQASEQFSMLAMWFAIIGQYNADVRWSGEANSVREALKQAAARSRSGDAAAFRLAQRRIEELTELVRGATFPLDTEASSTIDDWSDIVDRNSIMTRLEYSLNEELKDATASEQQLRDAADTVIHEAGIIAATSRVLQLPEMLDADDEDYRAYAGEMLRAAIQMKQAAVAKDLPQVLAALNRIEQACVRCHGDFR
jgi:cytochrome c556